MQNILLVDGYNMIGAWSELRELRDTNFEEARNRLIELMAEFYAKGNTIRGTKEQIIECFREKAKGE